MELSIIQQAYADYVDQYELEHLRMKYVSADARGRIRLLKRLQRTYWGVPEDIARLVVEDPDRVVRAWYARYAGRQMGGAFLALCELEDDPDPLVRACLVEGGHAYPNWESATELERLAYLRHCYDVEFILKLFDPENEELGLSQEDRTRYALTFLAARAAPGKMEGLSEYLAVHRGAYLIELMPKWPKNAGIQDFVYRFCKPGSHVGVVYEHCNEPRWRRLLLENVLSRGRRVSAEDMMALARKDPDDKCRELAHMDPWIRLWEYSLLEKLMNPIKAWRRDRRAVFKQALKSRDLAALRGLAQNKALKPRQLMKVWRAICALSGSSTDVIEVTRATVLVEKTIQAIQEPQPEQVEKHKRTTREQPVRQDARIAQAKLDAVANWVGVSLEFVATTIVCGWIGSAVGLLAGAVLYLLTGSLPLSVFAFASGLWAGVSIALLILFQLSYWAPHGRVFFIKLRGLQPYPEEGRPKRQEWPTEEEESQKRVFKYAREGRIEYAHDIWVERPQADEVDVEVERQRIERYKAALTEAGRR